MTTLRMITLAIATMAAFAQTAAAHYDPKIGRWIDRDPIAEEGGKNLYAFLSNQPVSKGDYLGLVAYDMKITMEYLDANPPGMEAYGDVNVSDTTLEFECECNPATKQYEIRFTLHGKIRMRIRNWQSAIHAMEGLYQAPQIVAGKKYSGREYVEMHERAHAARLKATIDGIAKQLTEREKKTFADSTSCLFFGLDNREVLRRDLVNISIEEDAHPPGGNGAGSNHRPGWDSEGVLNDDQIKIIGTRR